jgi:hypothetical protein
MPGVQSGRYLYNVIKSVDYKRLYERRQLVCAYDQKRLFLGNRHWEGVMKSRFLYIVFAIMLVILVTPFVRHAGTLGWLTATLLIAMIPLASYYALSTDSKRAVFIIILSLPFIALDAVNLFHTNRYLPAITYGFGILLYLYIIVLLLKDLLTRKAITTDMIYCAISIYLLIGIMWAGVYGLLESVSPGSFSATSGSVDLIYFSFVTLTTVGYGDVAPLTILSKRLAVFEAGMGGIYMAIIVAMIVGRYLSPEADQE